MSDHSRDDLLSLIGKIGPIGVKTSTAASPSPVPTAAANETPDPDGLAHLMGLIKADNPEDGLEFEKMMAAIDKMKGADLPDTPEGIEKMMRAFGGGGVHGDAPPLSEDDALELKKLFGEVAPMLADLGPPKEPAR